MFGRPRKYPLPEATTWEMGLIVHALREYAATAEDEEEREALFSYSNTLSEVAAEHTRQQVTADEARMRRTEARAQTRAEEPPPPPDIYSFVPKRRKVRTAQNWRSGELSLVSEVGAAISFVSGGELSQMEINEDDEET